MSSSSELFAIFSLIEGLLSWLRSHRDKCRESGRAMLLTSRLFFCSVLFVFASIHTTGIGPKRKEVYWYIINPFSYSCKRFPLQKIVVLPSEAHNSSQQCWAVSDDLLHHQGKTFFKKHAISTSSSSLSGQLCMKVLFGKLTTSLPQATLEMDGETAAHIWFACFSTSLVFNPQVAWCFAWPLTWMPFHPHLRCSFRDNGPCTFDPDKVFLCAW